ncbi:MtfA peptidase [Oryzomicrobium terrae]|uniref:MtfA peptidase n=1 Tax=Oryzomicrobium terrae TaxID=1735038 RepID=A0A5C1EAW5_9RHOO|nr:M90 family metallopeptidase [Oryzomicrobium terrae]QEL65327.1 MtfA peptidase [Oryzomicrobium terrae]
MIHRLLAALGLGRNARPAAIPEPLWRSTVAGLPFLAALNREEQGNLKQLAEAFLADKSFTGAGGLVLTDAICVSVAAQGCLPVLNLGLHWYKDWSGVVIYPDEFVIPRQIADETGVVHEYDEVAAGEAWSGGPLILSWRDVLLADEGYNVVIHEFAHKLDMREGEPDGVPPLHPGMNQEHWIEVLDAAYEDFCARVDAGEETWIDPYGAEHPGEFFAVLSETFFTFPEAVRDSYPALYALFVRFYRQDPAARLPYPPALPRRAATAAVPPASRASRTC